MDLAHPFSSKAARNVSLAPAPLALPGRLRRDAGRMHLPITRTPVPAPCSPLDLSLMGTTGLRGYPTPRAPPQHPFPARRLAPLVAGKQWPPGKPPSEQRASPKQNRGGKAGAFARAGLAARPEVLQG